MFTVFGLRCDRVDPLLVAGVIPGERAAAAVELDGDELDFSWWAGTVRGESGDADARTARAQVVGGGC
ncbi:hypothetical protein ACFWOT_18200 [Streptomyces sp. NPDC058440]|uniref:hypothetical protein n=1 Tax=Streptomyces sp. NPDC058440 TaxID=3346501 RepID=UPI00365CDCE9